MNDFFNDFGNLTDTEEFTGRGAGPIPPGSVVALQLRIRPPKETEADEQFPGYVRVAKTGARQLDVEYVVVGGRFAGRKIWEYITIGGPTAGHDKAKHISRSFIRAVLDSAQGLDPKDNSEQAAMRRVLRSWADLDGITFAAEVSGEWELSRKDGQYYYNNTIRRPVAPSATNAADTEAWSACIANGGDYIVDAPIPPCPQSQGGPATPAPAPAGAKPFTPPPPPNGAAPATGPTQYKWAPPQA